MSEENNSMSNTGLLEGICCPECNALGPFRVTGEAIGQAVVEDEGVTEFKNYDVDIKRDGEFTCLSCGHTFTLKGEDVSNTNTNTNTDSKAPTVKLSDLIRGSGAGFSDRTFELFCRDFMAKFMPGFPLGMLEKDFERWEFCQGEDRFTLEEVEFTPEGGVPSDYFVILDGERDEYYADGDDDMNVEHYLSQPDYYHQVLDASLWILEGDAEGVVDHLNQLQREREDEGKHGHPWAWNWAHIPDDRITTDELLAAGFTVAHYTGGDGDTTRLCGMDAGGYDFASSNFARLVAIVHENRSQYHWTVETDNGPALITQG